MRTLVQRRTLELEPTVEIPVLIQHVASNGFRATSFTPVPLAAEASTRDEALDLLRQLIRTQSLTWPSNITIPAPVQLLNELMRGQPANVELVPMQVSLPCEIHPWQALTGTWKDHPDAAEFERSLQEYRQQVDSDPERL